MSDEFEYPRDFADHISRESLKNLENLRDLVSAALPEIAGGFVFERAELLDREFSLEDWRRRESDLLFRIPFRDGDTELETLICVLLEHQSKPDVRMPLRLLLYAVNLEELSDVELEQLHQEFQQLQRRNGHGRVDERIEERTDQGNVAQIRAGRE